MIEPADVRDLEQEGVMGDIKLSWSSSVQDAFFNARRDILIQGLVARVERLEEVVADLLRHRRNQKGGN
jgi:hypothetical protein